MKKRTGSKLNGRQTEHLLYGWCLAVCDGPDIHFPFRDVNHRREMWLEHKEYLFSLEGVARIPGVFGNTPLPKGKKPSAFYDYEGKKKAEKGLDITSSNA